MFRVRVAQSGVTQSFPLNLFIVSHISQSISLRSLNREEDGLSGLLDDLREIASEAKEVG